MLTRLAGSEGASAVGAVAVELCPHVEDDQLATADLSLARLGVRKGAVRPGGNDRREGRLGALLAHPSLDRAGDVELGAPAEAAFQRPAPGPVGQLCSSGDRRQLGLVLDPTQLL